jgi:uncharacterized membrane protein
MSRYVPGNDRTFRDPAAGRQYGGIRRHPLWVPLLLLVVAFPLLLGMFYLHLATETFQLLGLSPGGAVLLLGASLLGSAINIPLTRRRIVLAEPGMDESSTWLGWFLPIVHYYPLRVTEETIALNVGGAVVPAIFSIYLLTLPTTSVPVALFTLFAVTVVARLFARPEPGLGITLPAFIPPLAAATAAHLIAWALGADPAVTVPAAYIGGSLGTLLGADVLNLPRLLREEEDTEMEVEAELAGIQPSRQLLLSIGGAGVFDGIFLTSIVAPLLARGV